MTLGPLCGVLDLSRGWLRLFGAGIAWRDNRRHRTPFSERYGYTKVLRIGAYSVTWLRATRTP